MFETGKYYLCKKCKEVNDEEINSFITNVFYTNYKSATNRTYVRSPSCRNDNYFTYETQEMMKFRVGCIYKCMQDNYLKDDGGQLVFIGKLDGFLFEEVKIDLHGCEKIIGAIEKHYGCAASVEPLNCVDGQYISYVCKVLLHSIEGYYFASETTVSQNPVSGLLVAYRNSRKTLAQRSRLGRALNHIRPFYATYYNYERI